MAENYQRKMEAELSTFGEQKKTLFLHVCCAPCSSAVLERLTHYFDITLFYYNPNTEPREEYDRRRGEIDRLLAAFPSEGKIAVKDGKYDREAFSAVSEGLEQEPEGGARCVKCYRMRLEETAKEAKRAGADYFTTTLSISPHKNAEALNHIGEQLSKEYGVPYLYADFKKKEGFKRSIQLSEEYGLYRQDYCGCLFSKKEAEAMRKVH